MATINYQFSDGHYEEIEVTEEFKREYEFLLVQERARYWKIKKQKQRAGLAVKCDLSLDVMYENGIEPESTIPDPLESLIEKEEQREYYEKLLRPLTDKQRQVYILFHLKGYKKVQIAAMLHICEKAVRKHLIAAHKKISKNFSE